MLRAAVANHLDARCTRANGEFLMQVRGVRLDDPRMQQVQDLPGSRVDPPPHGSRWHLPDLRSSTSMLNR
jgi:hypothetical protein